MVDLNNASPHDGENIKTTISSYQIIIDSTTSNIKYIFQLKTKK